MPGVAGAEVGFVGGAVFGFVFRGQRRHVLPDRIVRRVVDRGIEDGARRRVDDLGLELGQAFVAEAVGRGIEAADDEGVAGRFEREHLGVAERLGDDREAGEEVGGHGGRRGGRRLEPTVRRAEGVNSCFRMG